MKEKGFFRNLKEKLEYYLPMTVGSLFLFLIVLYSFYNVGRMVWINYNSNKDLEKEAVKIDDLENEVYYLRNQIAYFQTNSFKEKEARAKLAYKAPGEIVLAMPMDEKVTDSENVTIKEDEVKIPNRVLWVRYYFGQ